ncbi:MAG: SMP-30/gluconolactonase/LRE family protein [Acidobacteria bacterium]|nr:SMP-30/gluconolactonase/LRE family protein [Acidobacteriota bacterium]
MTKRFACSVVALAAGLTLVACSPSAEKSAPASESKPAAAASPAATASAPLLKIVRLDPAFDKLIATKEEVPTDGTVTKLSGGHKWTEGPVWNAKDKYLLFSDIPNNAIYQWQEGKEPSIFIQPSGYTGKDAFTGKEPGTNGLTYDAEGRLVACAHGDRVVVRLEDGGKKRTVLADKYNGKRFNSPNDLTFKSNGDLYFTDPIYGLPKGAEDPARELDFCGVYRLGKDGKVTLLTKEITRPNGIAFSPDEKKLYVASSDPDKAIWMAYDVKPDGTLTNGKVFFDGTAWAKAGKPGLPDGLKVDKAGNLFATGPGGVHVFSPEGKHLGTFDTGVPTANVAFGDDGATLYITANTNVLRVKLAGK